MTTKHYNPNYKVGTTQALGITGSSAATANGASDGIYDVRIVVTVDSYVEFGTTPTATTNSLIIPAYTPEHFKVEPGTKIAFLIVGSTTGQARVTELTQ
jgi:plastocyanin